MLGKVWEKSSLGTNLGVDPSTLILSFRWANWLYMLECIFLVLDLHFFKVLK